MKQIYIYMLFMVMMLILVTVMILVSVAFLTLMERKILGYIQIRKGPNKLGFVGIFQPFSDAIKLLSKETFMLLKFNFFYYFFSPFFMLILILMMWMIYPFFSNMMMMNLGLIYLMCCFSFSVYGLLISGWSSNSMYSMMGSIRSLSQSISYEVSLSLLMLILVIMGESFNLMYFFYIQENLSLMFYLWPILIMFLISLMAELNRTPFDFSEGESELVSGFNVEYMSVGFVLIFLSEYSSILFLSFMFSMFFLGGNFFNLDFYLKILFIMYFIVWVRGSLPRFRYDLLMYLCWLIILPFILNFMLYIYLFKMMI